jgi:predicted small lipoprotein YifL
MLRASQILVSGCAVRLVLAACMVAALPGCGQKGPLILPTGEAAAGRATVIETLSPGTDSPVVRPADIPAPPASAPPSGTASPVRN